MQISIHSILIWITSLIVASIAITIYLGSDKRSSKSFAFGSVCISLWIISVGFFISSTDQDSGLSLARLTYLLASIVSIYFLNFFYTFPEDTIPPRFITIFSVSLTSIFTYLFLFTDAIIKDVFPLASGTGWGWHFGSLSFLFELSFFGLFSYGIILIYKKYQKATDLSTKKHLKYMLWIIVVGSVPPSLCGIILPRFQYFDLNWLGPITEIFWIPIIAYSITKHHLFNTKIIAIEVVTFALWIIILIRTLMAPNFHEVLIEGSLLVVTVVFGILLIRSVLHEITQREKIQELATDLSKAYGHVSELNNHLERKVAEQTVEIRKSYEVEKKARVELQKLNETKDQFIMITQHHLRTPVTSLRWQLEEILAGTYGTPTIKLAEALKTADISVTRLTHIINNFLSITALKTGTDILSRAEVSLEPLIESALTELLPEITAKNLHVSRSTSPKDWPSLSIDADKVREVLLIILENAVHYNTKGGSIGITTKSDEDFFELTVENTGITINDEDKEKIFHETFYRNPSARELHPLGMGIGLRVARAIIQAHGGYIEIESLPNTQGTKVVMHFPSIK